MSNKDDELLEVLNVLKEEERKEQEHPNIEEKRSSKLKRFIKDRFSIKKIKEKVKENKIEYIISIFMIVYMILTIILNIKVVYYHSGAYTGCIIELDSLTESNTTGTNIIDDLIISNDTGYYEYENIVLSENKIIVYIIQVICIIGICIIPKNNKKSFICIIVLFVVCNAIIFNIAVQKEMTFNIYEGYKNIYGITIKRAY